MGKMKGGSWQGDKKPTLIRTPPQTRPKDTPLKSIGNSSGGKKDRG